MATKEEILDLLAEQANLRMTLLKADEQFNSEADALRVQYEQSVAALKAAHQTTVKADRDQLQTLQDTLDGKV